MFFTKNFPGRSSRSLIRFKKALLDQKVSEFIVKGLFTPTKNIVVIGTSVLLGIALHCTVFKHAQVNFIFGTPLVSSVSKFNTLNCRKSC